MIFDCRAGCAVSARLEHTGPAPLALPEGTLWIGFVAQGGCALQGGDEVRAAGVAGDLLLGGGAPVLLPTTDCRLLCLCLAGAVPQLFCQGLAEPCFVPAAGCPGADELAQRLYEGDDLPAAEASRLGYALLCALGRADEPARTLPPLVADALAAIRENYMDLYGVEELSEQLGVSKCHLVRSFTAAIGVPPGRYLTQVRVEAVKQLLLEGGHDLEAIAALCGFSGANYLCRVFRRVVGVSPAAWRAANRALPPAPALPPVPRQGELYM